MNPMQKIVIHSDEENKKRRPNLYASIEQKMMESSVRIRLPMGIWLYAMNDAWRI